MPNDEIAVLSAEEIAWFIKYPFPADMRHLNRAMKTIEDLQAKCAALQAKCGPVIDRDRPEGVYCKWDTYPPDAGVLVNNILMVERVSGDGTVSVFSCTREEAAVICEFITQKAKQSEEMVASRG